MKTTRGPLFRWLFTIVFSFPCVVWAHGPASDVMNEAAAEWIGHNIPIYMEEAHMPGFSIAVVQDGETIYAGGFGLRDTQKVLPATADTLYGIGSITKSFVAIGILQLVERGEIGLDDPVSKHLPFELGMAEHPITIHHLLTHSLGIPSLATSTVAIYRGLGYDTGVPLGSSDDFYRLVNGAKDEVVAKPGERFFYHNAAWRMLGHIIQEKSGQPFHEYIKKRVIDPLGMQRTTMSLTAFRSDPDHIRPNLRIGGEVTPSRFPYPDPDDNPEFAFLSAAGGIVSSVREMTHYINALINLGKLEGGRLASAESFAEMQRFHIASRVGHYGEVGYGFGLSITPEFIGHKMVGHGGSVVVSTAYMAFIPDLRIGVVMMGNSSGMDYATIAESVFAVLMGKDPAEVIPALQIRERTERLLGHYEVYRGLEKLEVVNRGGLLRLEQKYPAAEEPVETVLVPEDSTLSSTLFYSLRNGLKSPVEFVLRDDGGIDLFVGRYCFHKVD